MDKEGVFEVYSGGKDHALYLWIHVQPTADARKVAQAAAGLQKIVASVCPKDLTDEEDEVWAGVGFGDEFYARLGKVAPAPYAYPHRAGANGDMPSTGGDIFIHAKSNSVSKLYEVLLPLSLSGECGTPESLHSTARGGNQDDAAGGDGEELPGHVQLRVPGRARPQRLHRRDGEPGGRGGPRRRRRQPQLRRLLLRTPHFPRVFTLS